MTLDKNTFPYYDNFDETKKYLQQLFRPGYAVQARELSQIQSILQNQIERFGNHVFKEGSMVIPGEVGLDLNTPFVKVADQFSGSDINVDNFLNRKIIGTTSGTIASVIDVEETLLGDPNTFYLKYETGTSSKTMTGSITSGSPTVSSISIAADTTLTVGTLVTGTGIPSNTFIEAITDADTITLSNNATVTNASASLTAITADGFVDGETLTTEDGTYSAIVEADSNGHDGFGSRVRINSGIYYALGYFNLVDTQTLILDKYSNTPSYKVGLAIVDEFVTEADDITLNDPATGTPNFNAPGAHRYKVDLVLAKYGLEEELPESFIELIRVKNGVVQRLVTRPEYSELEKTLARRTNDESGNYTVREFPVQLREHLDDGTNYGVYTASNGGDETKMAVSVEPGKAYVQGFEIETGTTKILEVDKARTTDRNNNSITPFSLGNYVEIDNLKSTYNITTFETVDLLDTDKAGGGYPGTVLGTARVRGLEFVSGTPGTAGAKYKLFLFDIQMGSDTNGVHSFSDVRAIATSGQTVDADVVLSSGDALLEGVTDNKALFLLPDASVKTLEDGIGGVDTNYLVKRYESGVMTGTDLTLTGGGNEIYSSYSVTNYHVSIITASGTATGNGFNDGDIIDMSAGSNAVVLGGSPTGRQVTLTIPDIADSTIAVVSTITKSVEPQKTKTLATNSETLAHANTIQLTKADIFDIVSITDATTAEDITDQYVLDNGQRDNFYDRGSLVFKQQYKAPAGNVDIDYRYFNHGSGDYFSVDSYDGVIDYDEIQTYTSPSTGETYNLRNTIDFRPRVDDAGTGFSVLAEIVANGENFTTDYDYYLPRTDKIFLDSFGNFRIVSGIPSKAAISPASPEDGITLYELEIPAYTNETTDIVVKRIDNKRYTMRDIGRLEKRIENIEYYSSLSLLEKDTEALFIDDGTGANRFKNGFLVDNFTSHLVGEVGLLEYACSIDKEQGLLRPQFASNSVSMTLDAGDSSNYQKTGDLITLPYTTESFITQPYASKTENINPYDVFNWVGNIKLTPESDEWYESTQAPDRIITNDDGLADSLAALNGQTIWNDWQTTWVGTPLTTTRVRGTTRRIWRQTVRGVGVRDQFEATNLVAREEGQTRSGIQLNVQETTNTQSLGDRVINSQTIPFIRENTIEFSATSLKPNTEVFPFFDNVNVSAFTRPTGGSLGESLITNNNGEVSGEFEIPNTDNIRFRTGERVFRLVDDENNDANFTTTSGDGTYTARGILETKQETILSTRSARIVTTEVTDERTIIGQDLQQTTFFGGWFDPLAQTFLIEEEGGVMLNKIDIFFATKDTTGVPVTLQIRNVVNGYPGQFILPFSEVTINPDQVNTSTDAQTATSFTFESPVYLQNNQEYCFVLLANSIEYTVWVSQIGGFDVNTGERISEQPYAGVMFKSQNASTWTADQEQDIKFDIHRCVFNTGVTGSVVFKNDTIDNVTLPLDPYSTTNASATVLVYHPNHGLQDGESVTHSGLTADINNIPFAEFNATHVIDYIDFDHYEITLTTNADATGAGGSNTVVSSRNIRADVINPLIETVVLPQTGLGFDTKVADTSKVLHSAYVPLEVKENTEFTDERIIYGADNAPASKSVHLRGQFLTTNQYISPIIDTQRASVITVTNRINNDSTDELEPRSGDALARYITKKITLRTPATGVRVYFSAFRPPLATIKVYIKHQEDADKTTAFDDLGYTELTAVDYPQGSEIDVRDYVFELNDLEPYSVYSIKIVMLSNETSDAPLIGDFRTIALA